MYSNPKSNDILPFCVVRCFSTLKGSIYRSLSAFVLMTVSLIGDDLKYEVDGVVVNSRYRSDGTIAEAETNRFTVYVKSPFWMVSLAPASPDDKTALHASVELGTDLQSTYQVSVINPKYDRKLALMPALQEIERKIASEPSEVKRQTLKRAKDRLLITIQSSDKDAKLSLKARNRAIGSVFPFDYPLFENGSDNVLLWFVYCSQSYFKDADKSTLVPRLWRSQDVEQRIRTNLFDAHTTLLAQQPKLPKTATILHDGTRMEPSGQTTNGGPIMVGQWDMKQYKYSQLPEPFAKGYTNAIYEVLQFTNTFGLMFPQISRLDVYRLLANTTYLDRRVEVRATKIRNSCLKSSFVPELAEATLVEDLRNPGRHQDGPLTYTLKAGLWPRTTNASILTKHDNEIIASQKVIKKARQRILMIVFIAIAVSGFYLLRRCNSDRTKTNA
jgi:hypothetical protein